MIGNVRFLFASRRHVPLLSSPSPATLQCQWQDLKDLFRQAGPVVRADVVLGPTTGGRGALEIGTVLFQTEANAVKRSTGTRSFILR